MDNKEERKKIRDAFLKGDHEVESSEIDLLLEKLQSESRRSFFTVNLDCNYNDTLTRESIINEIKKLYNEYNYLHRSIYTIVVSNPGRHFFPWYLNSELLEQEIRTMSNIYPNFKLKRMIDGRLCWTGSVAPVIVREDAEYELKIIYGHAFKGEPFTIEIMSTDINCNNKRDYCYAFDSLGKIFGLYSNSVVDCITMVTKWLNTYELLLSDYITYEEFRYIAL